MSVAAGIVAATMADVDKLRTGGEENDIRDRVDCYTVYTCTVLARIFALYYTIDTIYDNIHAAIN
jgi:hypothetical protein